jgi:putative transcriptional regulator
MKKDQANLSNNLKKYRFEKGEISQQELANAVGVTRLTIHSIETGKFNPSVLLALKISRFFGKPVEEIFFLENNNKKSDIEGA